MAERKRKLYSTRKFIKLIKSLGFEYDRGRGSHVIYKRGEQHISFPLTSRDLNSRLTLKLLKEIGYVK